ncbi:MAG: PAS domain-containing protein [Deltaproteobacteria bacterium]|nr:PAS domain-containing protein [Deltaproteobacteria bacterium]
MRTWWVAGVMLGVLALVGLGTRLVVTRSHDAQVAQLETETRAGLTEAARSASADLDDLSDVLHLTDELMASGGQAREHERELHAILEAVGNVRVMATYSADGQEALYLPDHNSPPEFSSVPFRPAMAATAGRALGLADGRIAVSSMIAGAPSGWLRVFASRFGSPGGPAGAVAVLVDTEPMFSGLRVVGSRADTEQLVLGPNFKVARSTSPAVAAAFASREQLGVPRFAAAFTNLAAGLPGTEVLSSAEAARLGLPASERILGSLPVPMKNGPSWSAVVLASTASVRQNENRLVVQLWLGAAVAVAVLLGVGAYVAASTRRSAALKQTRLHVEELARVNERTQSILDHIPAGVVALSEAGSVLAVNKVLRERSGAAAGATLRSVFAQADEASLARLHALVQAALAAGQVQSLLGEALSLFGSQGHYRVHAVPLHRGDPEVRIVLVLEDLSSLHALQAQLIQAEKLATVGVLAAGIAHEIGTPLGVVRGRAEYVASKLGEGHSQAGSIQVIVEQIDRVSRTIRQLLDFARVKPATPRSVAVGPALRAAEELLGIEARRRGVELGLAVEEGVPAVSADPDQLQQVLINLALNALDASERGSKVTLGAAAEGAAGVCLWVRDAGAGIPAENLHRVFDPFFTTKKRGQGTGLGLTMVAEIVRNHGGHLEVQSAVGQGTSVTLHWPAAADEEAGHAA